MYSETRRHRVSSDFFQAFYLIHSTCEHYRLYNVDAEEDFFNQYWENSQNRID